MRKISTIGRIEDLEKNHQRIRVAFWLLLGYVVFLTLVVYGVQNGLWRANDAVWEVLSIR